MKANSDTLSWLASVPASDQNFKEALKKSDLATCEEALKHVTGKGTRAAIEARIKKLFRAKMEAGGAKLISPSPAAQTAEKSKNAPSGHAGSPGKLSNTRRITLRDLETLPPVPTGNPDAEMGAVLTEQYHKATGGMVEVLKFGALMIEMEAGLEARVSACGHAKLGNEARRGTGFKAWLQEHAPEISRQTAYRLKAVTESVAEQYEQIVGAKVAKQFALPALVTTPADQLPAAAQAKQLELFSFVSGTSQRSWLDRFKPAHRPGGDTSAHRGKTPRKKLTLKEAEELERTICRNTAQHLATLHKQRSFVVLNDAEMDGLINHAGTVLEVVKAWRGLSHREREKALHDHLAQMLAE